MFYKTFRNYKKTAIIILAMVMGLFSYKTSLAEEVNLLRINKPGSQIAMFLNAVRDSLGNTDYKFRLRGLDSCAVAYTWYSNNKDKKSLLVLNEQYSIQNIIFPDNKIGCNFEITEDSLVSSISRNWWMICAHADTDMNLNKFVEEKDKVLALFGLPIIKSHAKKILDSIGADIKILPIASTIDMINLFNTHEIDYVYTTSRTTTSRLQNAKCFATTANPENRDLYYPGLESIEEVYPSVHFKNYNTSSMKVLAYGFTKEEIQVLRDELKNNPSTTFKKIQAADPADNRSIKEQLENIKTISSMID